MSKSVLRVRAGWLCLLGLWLAAPVMGQTDDEKRAYLAAFEQWCRANLPGTVEVKAQPEQFVSEASGHRPESDSTPGLAAAKAYVGFNPLPAGTSPSRPIREIRAKVNDAEARVMSGLSLEAEAKGRTVYSSLVRWRRNHWTLKLDTQHAAGSADPDQGTLAQQKALRLAEDLDKFLLQPQAVPDSEPEIALDRSIATRFSAIKITGKGFKPKSLVNIYFDDKRLFEFKVMRKDGGLPTNAWIWVRDEIAFGTRKIWAEEVGPSWRKSKPVMLQVEPISHEKLRENLDAVLDMYCAAIPANERWKETMMPEGAVGYLHNMTDMAGGVVRSAIEGFPPFVFMPSVVFRLAYERLGIVWPNNEYVCEWYRDRVLVFLTKLRFHDDPLIRAKLDGLDYAPFVSGPADIGLSVHAFAVIWPHVPALGDEWAWASGSGVTPTWRNTGLSMDPWPRQKPWVFELQNGCGDWAKGTKYAGRWTHFNYVYILPRPQPNRLGNNDGTAGKAEKDLYPLLGAEYYDPSTRLGAMPTPTEDLSVGAEPDKSVLVQCPVRLEIRDASGRFTGMENDGQLRASIPRSEVSVLPDGAGGKVWFVALPEGDIDLTIVGEGTGQFELRTANRGQPAYQYPRVPITAGAVARIRLTDAPGPAPLTTPEGKTVMPGKMPPPTANVPGGAPGTATNPPAGPAGGSGDPGGASPPAAADVVRTLVYHELTAVGPEDAIEIANGLEPRLSATGNRAVMSLRPSPDDPARRSRIAVVQTDGSGFRVVDTIAGPPPPPPAHPRSNRVAAGGGELRVVADDGKPRLLRALSHTGDVRITADGRRIIYCQASNGFLAETGQSKVYERGIWGLDADGGSWVQLTGPAAVAQVLGVPPENVGNFYSQSRGSALDISADGSRIVFLVNHRLRGEESHVCTMNGDGSGLRKVFSGRDFVANVGISDDGRTIAWGLSAKGGSAKEGWVAGFDGAGARKLTDQAGLERSLSLSSDGTSVLYGSEGCLHRSDGSGVIALGPGGNVLNGKRFGGWRPTHMLMSKAPDRFLFVLANSQLAFLALDPPDPGLAPRITEVGLSPPDVQPDTRRLMKVRARIAGPHPLVGQAAHVYLLREGRHDPTITGGEEMRDDAKGSGDEVHGDGIYAHGTLHGNANSPPGPRSVRVMAEVAAPDGRHHATVVDFDPAGR